MGKFSEANIQEEIVTRFKYLVLYKQLNRLCVLYSNRNENVGIKSGIRIKRQGRIAGIPDLTLLYDGNIAFIEVKTPERHRTTKGVETKLKGMETSQIEFYEKYIKPMNIPFAVVSSVKDFEDFVFYLGILKK